MNESMAGISLAIKNVGRGDAINTFILWHINDTDIRSNGVQITGLGYSEQEFVVIESMEEKVLMTVLTERMFQPTTFSATVVFHSAFHERLSIEIEATIDPVDWRNSRVRMLRSQFDR